MISILEFSLKVLNIFDEQIQFCSHEERVEQSPHFEIREIFRNSSVLRRAFECLNGRRFTQNYVTKRRGCSRIANGDDGPRFLIFGLIKTLYFQT